MHILKRKDLISIYVSFIFLILFFNTCNIYGQNKNGTIISSNANIKSLDANIKSLNATANSLNDTIKSLNASQNFNSNATNKPVSSIKLLFGDIGQYIPLFFLAIVAVAMVIPLLMDMILAYMKSWKDGSGRPAVGMDGLYRTLMTFGVVLLAGIVLLYLLSLITVYNNTALIETLRNLSTILGTGLATIIAFYFGIRGSQSAAESSVRRLHTQDTVKDITTPFIIKTKPIHDAKNVPTNPYIYAKFSEPIDVSSINKTTFTVVDSKNNVVDGEPILIEKNTKALFKISSNKKLESATEYIATVESEVTDIEGNSMIADKVWSFTTKEDQSSSSMEDKRPSIQEQSKIPPAGKLDVDTTDATKIISFMFDKEMDESTINTITVRLLEGGIALPQLHGVKLDDSDKRKVIVDPGKILLSKTQYTIKVSQAVRDKNGQSLENEQEWSFTTK